MLFFHLYKAIFLLFCFPNIIMYVLNIASAMKKVAVDELRYFIFENCYKGIEFAKGRSYYSMKHLKNKGFVVA